MSRVWSDENKFNKWLLVEILAVEAWAELGVVPREAAAAIRRKGRVDLERIAAIEAETRHDVVAFTRALAENLGEEAKYVHYGLTSSDVVDTALAAQLQEAVDLLLSAMAELLGTLARQAKEHKLTVMIGRTHGVHAEPTTLGLKFALWHQEMGRNLERMRRARAAVSFGKISGAVGTYANVDPFVEEYVCKHMSLNPAPISTQVLQRDRHAELLAAIAITGSTLDKIATEIRGLQRTEIREVEEPFYAGQKGSSAMPHKRNPVSSERISGLARLLRGYLVAALEDIPLWHERDISHSSVERVILPDATTLLHFMLQETNRILGRLHIYPDNMLSNLQERSFGLVFSQQVLLKLVEKGMQREEAYDLVQKAAMQSWEKGEDFRRLIMNCEPVQKHLSLPELEECFNPSNHLKHIDRIYRRLGL